MEGRDGPNKNVTQGSDGTHLEATAEEEADGMLKGLETDIEAGIDANEGDAVDDPLIADPGLAIHENKSLEDTETIDES